MITSSDATLTKVKVKNLLKCHKGHKMQVSQLKLNRIVSLIEGYRKVEKQYYTTSIKNIQNILAGYKDISSATLIKFENLLQGYKDKVEKLREAQQTSADDLNILDVLGFTYDEVKHSKFLAFLLDPIETHAQGNLFFKIFLDELKLPAEYAESKYIVKKEVRGDESIIDIRIRSKVYGDKGFVIDIENKVGAGLGDTQIERESKALEKEAKIRSIPDNRRHGFLLSVKNEENLTGTLFNWIGWKQIVNCLNIFINRAQASRAKWTAEQYVKCIEKHIIKETLKIKEEEKKDEIE